MSEATQRRYRRLCQEGKLAYYRGHSKNALHLLRQASALDPEDPWPKYQQTKCLIALTRFDQAIKQLDELIATHPSHLPMFMARKGVALCKRADADGAFENAAVVLQQAVQLDPTNGTLRVWLADAQWGAGRRAEALLSYHTATELDHQNQNLGWRFSKLKRAL